MSSNDERFADLYRRYRRHITAYCARRTSPAAVDDAVADTFLTAWRRIEEVPWGDAALPWLYGVAYKVLGHQWRGSSRRKRLNAKLVSLGVTPATGPEEVIVSRQETRQVRTALERLNRTDREILLLAAWEGLDHSEIADALEIKPGAVRQRLYQARKKLTREYNRLERGRMAGTPAAQEGGVR